MAAPGQFEGLLVRVSDPAGYRGQFRLAVQHRQHGQGQHRREGMPQAAGIPRLFQALEAVPDAAPGRVPQRPRLPQQHLQGFAGLRPLPSGLLPPRPLAIRLLSGLPLPLFRPPALLSGLPGLPPFPRLPFRGLAGDVLRGRDHGSGIPGGQ